MSGFVGIYVDADRANCVVQTLINCDLIVEMCDYST